LEDGKFGNKRTEPLSHISPKKPVTRDFSGRKRDAGKLLRGDWKSEKTEKGPDRRFRVQKGCGNRKLGETKWEKNVPTKGTRNKNTVCEKKWKAGVSPN